MSQQINLYNPLLLKKQKLFSLVAMLQALGLILLGSLLFYAYAWYSVNTMKKRVDETSRMHASTLAQLERLQEKSEQREPSKLLQEEIIRLEAQVRTRKGVVDVLVRGEVGNKEGFSEYFRALSRQTPDGLWLTAFEVTGSGEIAIKGRALKAELVPVFISQLSREAALAGKNFDMLEMRLPNAAVPPGSKPAAPQYIEFSLHNAANRTP